MQSNHPAPSGQKSSVNRRQRGGGRLRVAAQCVIERLETRLTLSATSLTTADVQSVADTAINLWKATGLSDTQLQVLQNLNYQVADLGTDNLGSYSPGVVTLDDDAASNLWFIDPTPGQNEEFSTGDDATLEAPAGSDAYGKVDLLTVLLHEQGHALGLADVLGDSDDVMLGSVQAGERRLPFSGEAADAVPGSITGVEYLTTNPAGSTLPFNNLQPYLAMNYAIALQGVFPAHQLGADEYLGAVELFASNFAPIGYALAAGQLLPINQNQALFSILGTTYGGDGRTTFALPDLQGRVPIGAGEGPGLQGYTLGEASGVESVTLGVNNIAAHTHTVPNTIPGAASPTSPTGGGVPFNNLQPTLALTPVVTMEGIYPARDFSNEDVLGSVSWFAGNFAPQGTHLADGSLLSIAQNTALFSLLGTTYGGDGISNFALPDLRGRMGIGAGNGPGLSPIILGEQGGTESVTPTINILPAHAHTIGSPTIIAATGSTGGNQPFDNRQPYLGLNYTIALTGIFPVRSLQTGEVISDPYSDNPNDGFLSGDQVLDDDTAMQLIAPLVQQGIQYWRAAGADDAQIARLESMTVSLGDLDPGELAFTGDDQITIDRDASDRGWFVDPTPSDNSEFGSVDPRTGELIASDPEASSHFDLLTAIMHEEGHVLGLDHTPLPGHIMYGGLDVGERVLPQVGDLAQSTPSTDDSNVQFLEAQPDLTSVEMFAGTFAPRGWGLTNGQILPINQNTALFSLLGTTYGGNGVTTFQLPGLQGRAAVGAGAGPGLSPYVLGEIGGAQSVTLTISQLPAHTHNITIESVTNVTSSTPNGTYGTGANISIQVTFNATVNVTGTPQMAVNSGGTASYSSGTGTNTLTFTYNVGAGQNSPDLDYTSTNALTLNGGTISDANGVNPLLTLPAPGTTGSLGANKAIVINTTASAVTNVSSINANNTYGVGSVITITVDFNSVETVTGTPLLALNSGGTASYASGSGTSTLIFAYTVAAGQNSSDLDYTSTSALTLNGGTISGSTGSASLTLPAPGAAGSLGANKHIVIDTTPGTITNVSSTTANGTYGTGAVIAITVSFSKAENVTGTPQLALNSGGTANYSSGSGTSTLNFTYIVAAGQNSTDLDFTSVAALTLNGGTISDSAVNAANLTLPAPGAAGSLGFNKNIVINTAVNPATVTAVSALWGASGSAALFTAGDGLRLLAAGRNNDLGWLGINRLTITLSQAATLSPGDVSVTGIKVANYGPVTISGSGTSYTITFAQAINAADRVTVTIGNAGITPYTRRLDVLVGDFNDDGFVTSADMVGINNQTIAPYNVLADLNGDGVVDINDILVARKWNGTKL